MSKTITISDESAAFLVEFNRRLQTQDNRATASPYYFTVRCVREIATPEEFSDEKRFVFGGDDFTEDELKKFCEENDYDFEKTKRLSVKVGVQDVEEFKNFFFTEEGYKEHIELNGHNYRRFKKFDSYVDHAFRNPEITSLLAAVKEIGTLLLKEEVLHE